MEKYSIKVIILVGSCLLACSCAKKKRPTADGPAIESVQPVQNTTVIQESSSPSDTPNQEYGGAGWTLTVIEPVGLPLPTKGEIVGAIRLEALDSNVVKVTVKWLVLALIDPRPGQWRLFEKVADGYAAILTTLTIATDLTNPTKLSITATQLPVDKTYVLIWDPFTDVIPKNLSSSASELTIDSAKVSWPEHAFVSGIMGIKLSENIAASSPNQTVVASWLLSTTNDQGAPVNALVDGTIELRAALPPRADANLLQTIFIDQNGVSAAISPIQIIDSGNLVRVFFSSLLESGTYSLVISALPGAIVGVSGPTINSPPANAKVKNGSLLNVSCSEAGLSIAVTSTGLSTNPTAATCTSTAAINIALNWVGGADATSPTLAVTATDSLGILSSASNITYTVDLTAPTVSIVKTSANIVASGATVNFTATFSEPVLGFTSSDISQAGNATVLTWSVSGTGPSYNISTISPSQNTMTIQPAIAAGAVSDVAGNLSTAAASFSGNVATIDTAPPSTPTISLKTPSTATGTNIRPTFSVTSGFEIGGIVTIAAGSCNATAIATSGVLSSAPASRDLTITQDAASSATNYYAVATDNLGNAACSAAVTYTYLPPPSTPTLSALGSRIRSGALINVTCGGTNTSNIIKISNALLSSNPTTAICNGATSVPVTLNWSAGGSGQVVSVLVENDQTLVQSSSTTSSTFTVDLTAPTVTISRAAGQAESNAAGATINFTATFSEEVSGLTTSDVVQVGTATGLSWTVSTTDYIVYNISATAPSVGAVSLKPSIAAAAVIDLAGNDSMASVFSGAAAWVLSTGTLDTSVDQSDTTPKAVDGMISTGVTPGGTAGDEVGLGIEIDASGNVYVAGYAHGSTNQDDMTIWKYKPDTVTPGKLIPDTAFGNSGVYRHANTAGSDRGQALRLANGYIYVAGYLNTGTGSDDMVVWKISATTGALDATFGNNSGYFRHSNAAGGNGVDRGLDLVIDPSSGAIYVSGYSYSSTSSSNDLAVWKLTSTGAIDTAFNSTGYRTYHHNPAGWPISNSSDVANSIDLDSSGNVYIAGYVTNANAPAHYDLIVSKITSVGAYDSGFGTSGIFTWGGSAFDIGYSIKVQSDGKLVVFGQMHNGSNNDTGIWRLTSAGAIDTSFSGGMILTHFSNSDYFLKGLIDDAGFYYAAGMGFAFGNAVFMRFNGNSGSVDNSFSDDGKYYFDFSIAGDEITNSTAYGIALGPDGRIYATGQGNTGSNLDMIIWVFK